MSLTVEFFIHMDVPANKDWSGDPEERSLTDLGLRQAERMANEMALEPVNAVYASTNIRSRQSIEPLAKRFNLPIGDVPHFEDVHDLRGRGSEPLASAYLAGSAAADLEAIRRDVPEGRVVICSNGGDIVPGLIAYLAGNSGSELVGKAKTLRGSVYKAVFEQDTVHVSLREASSDFPS